MSRASRLRTGVVRFALLAAPIFLALSQAWAGPAGAPESDAFTPEEMAIKRALQKEFNAMKARAYIVRGTRLYLHEPHRSKYYNVNSLGLRGGEVEPKRKNGFNIMLLGGSTVFGDWTKADDQTIPALLQARLQGRYPGRAVTVYNLGVVGYEFQREIDLAKRYWKRLKPDLVLFYHGGNNAFLAYSSGYFPVRAFNKEDETILVKKIGSGVRLFEQLRMLRKRLYGEAWERRSVTEDEKRENLGSFVRGYREDAAAIARFFREEGVPVLFVLQPVLATRAGRTVREEGIAQSSERQRSDFADFYRSFWDALEASREADGLEIHNFMDAFDEYEGELYFDPIHVNLAGNRIIADKLFGLIEEKGLIAEKKPEKADSR